MILFFTPSQLFPSEFSEIKFSGAIIDILLLLFLISLLSSDIQSESLWTHPSKSFQCTQNSKVRDMELLIHLIAPLEAYGLCACGPFQWSSGQPTHPTQTICFQQPPNQVLQPSTILFTRPFEMKETAQTQCTNSAGMLVCCVDTGTTACFRNNA